MYQSPDPATNVEASERGMPRGKTLGGLAVPSK
jgi:hypothetical protein